MQDPTPYLNAHGIEVPCAMSPDKSAVVDADHRVLLNWEVFYFSTEDLKEEFEHAPTRYCGLLTDPVTRMRFDPLPESPHVVYAGRFYYFYSDSTASLFRSDPAALANPSYSMARMPGDE